MRPVRYLVGATPVCAAAFMLFAAGAAPAQETTIEKTNDPAPPPGWVLACTATPATDPLQCRMSQELFSAEARARVLAVSVAKAASGTGYEMTLALPHGVYLPAGVSVKVDSNPAVKTVIESSSPNGIFAILPMDEGLTATIKRGSTMMVNLRNMAGKDLQIPVSLAGFTATLTRMQALK